MRNISLVACALLVTLWLAHPIHAGTYFFSTGNPDGKIATL
jgi:hypothetical protein